MKMRSLMATTPSPCRTRSSFPGSARSSGAGADRKELVALPQHEARQDQLLGRSIRKSFNGQFFYGQVFSIDLDADTGERFYHVTYEDGDEEHMPKQEVEPLLQPGRVSLGQPVRGGRMSGNMPPSRTSLGSGMAPAGFPFARATPRPSDASLGHNPSSGPMRPGSLHGDFRGHPHAGGADGNLISGKWYAAAIAAIVLICGMLLAPSCFSCATSAASPSLDLGADIGLSESSAPWMMPSNDALIGSLPTPSSMGFDTTPEPMPAEAPSWESMTARPEAQAAESTFWRFEADPEQPRPTDASADKSDAEEADAPNVVMSLLNGILHMAGADTSFGQLWRSIADAAEYSLALLHDFAEFGVMVSVFLLIGGLVLFVGSIGQQPAGAGAPLLPPPGDAQNPLLPGAHMPLDASPQHPVIGVSPLRNDPYGRPSLAIGASPHTAASPLLVPAGLPSRLGPETAAVPAISEVQVGVFYVAMVGKEHKVVKTLELNAGKNMVSAKGFSCQSSRTGALTFKSTQDTFELPVTSLLQGPFQVTAGRAPKHISQMFEGAPAAPMDAPTPVRAPQANLRNGYFEMSGSRFRYPSALRKMQELGFEDCAELRDILTSYNGNVNQACQEFWTES